MIGVTLVPVAASNLLDLPPRIKDRFAKLLDRMKNWPAVSGAKPLRGELAGFYRLRTGDYRLLFRVEKDEVIVERIGHQDGFYGE